MAWTSLKMYGNVTTEFRKGNKTMNTTYTFITKGGKTYSAGGDNRFDAQLNIEVSFGIDLKGATFQEVYKLRVVRTGTVR